MEKLIKAPVFNLYNVSEIIECAFCLGCRDSTLLNCGHSICKVCFELKHTKCLVCRVEIIGNYDNLILNQIYEELSSASNKKFNIKEIETETDFDKSFFSKIYNKIKNFKDFFTKQQEAYNNYINNIIDCSEYNSYINTSNIQGDIIINNKASEYYKEIAETSENGDEITQIKEYVKNFVDSHINIYKFSLDSLSSIHSSSNNSHSLDKKFELKINLEFLHKKEPLKIKLNLFNLVSDIFTAVNEHCKLKENTYILKSTDPDNLIVITSLDKDKLLITYEVDFEKIVFKLECIILNDDYIDDIDNFTQLEIGKIIEMDIDDNEISI